MEIDKSFWIRDDEKQWPKWDKTSSFEFLVSSFFAGQLTSDQKLRKCGSET